MTITISRPDGEGLTLDATPTQTYDASYRATDHPVEDGGNVSDHIQKEPITYIVNGLISDTPLASQENAGQQFRGLKALEFLEETASSGTLVTVLDERLGLIQNVAIIDHPADLDTRQAFDFEITFKRIRRARSEQVKIPPERTTVASAAGEQDVGDQAFRDDLRAAQQQARQASLTADRTREQNQSIYDYGASTTGTDSGGEPQREESWTSWLFGGGG